MLSPSDSGITDNDFADVLSGFMRILSELSNMAGLFGFDTIVEKIDEAEEECEVVLTLQLRNDQPLLPKAYDNVHQTSHE